MSVDLPRILIRSALLGLALASSACTVVRVDSYSRPPSIRSRGLIDGYAAVGIPAETHLLHASLLEGRSSGAVGELVIWKLLRLEVGLLGASVGVGPFDLALGVLAYEPRLPDYVEPESEPRTAEAEACPECEAAPAAEPED